MSFSYATDPAKAVSDLSVVLFKNSGRIEEISGRREKTGMYASVFQRRVGRSRELVTGQLSAALCSSPD